MGLFYSNESGSQLIGYTDAGFLSNPHNGRSQTRYFFTCGGTVVSWRSTKQTLAATLSNHAEIIAVYKASWECVWLKAMTQHIKSMCGSFPEQKIPTILYEDNIACIAQLKRGYIKGNRTKHISPKFFFTHDLIKSGDIDVQ